MKRVRWLWLLLCAAVIGCADGGPVGTGIGSSSISGNVAAVDTSMRSTALMESVHVSIAEMPSIEDTTDADGNFELTGDFSGPVTVRFTAGQVGATTEPIDIPLGAEVVLSDVQLRAGVVRYVKPQVRRFFGRIALVDCTVDVPGAAEILADDRKPATANQFLIRLSPDTVIIGGNGVVLQCNQLKNTDAIAIEGVIRSDRTIDAIVVVIAPPPPTDAQPVVEVRFRGTVDIVNCTSGNIQMTDDMAGERRLRLRARSVLVDAALQPTTCDTISVGSRIEGKGLKVGRTAALDVVRITIRPPL
jgi:hypothetical protein